MERVDLDRVSHLTNGDSYYFCSCLQIKYKQQECTEELYQTLKGRLTQELLCRWWYAIEWPPKHVKEPVSHHLHF